MTPPDPAAKRVDLARIGSRKPRLLYLLMENDYGRPELGPGHERFNVIPAIESFPFESRQFDYAQRLLDDGYWGSMAALRGIVEEWRPDALFMSMYQEQVGRDVMAEISRNTGTVTVGWFSDDHWRFDGYSRYWANAFDWVVTTDAEAVARYREVGQPNVILSQWAANTDFYRPTGTGLRHDVTFVGQAYGERRGLVGFLESHGVPVATWGPGWTAGRVSQAEMVEIFSSSRVNLNFAASSRRGRLGNRLPEQIKGRVFEVPACGGLLLTGYAPHLEDYFDLDREIVAYRDRRDMLRKVRALLADEERRAAIASAGHARTVRDHTWVLRLTDIFERIGLLPRADEPRRDTDAG